MTYRRPGRMHGGRLGHDDTPHDRMNGCSARRELTLSLTGTGLSREVGRVRLLDPFFPVTRTRHDPEVAPWITRLERPSVSPPMSGSRSRSCRSGSCPRRRSGSSADFSEAPPSGLASATRCRAKGAELCPSRNSRAPRARGLASYPHEVWPRQASSGSPQRARSIAVAQDVQPLASRRGQGP